MQAGQGLLRKADRKFLSTYLPSATESLSPSTSQPLACSQMGDGLQVADELGLLVFLVFWGSGANAVPSPPGCAGLGPAGKGMHRASKGRRYAIFPSSPQALEAPFSVPGTVLGALCLQTWQ